MYTTFACCFTISLYTSFTPQDDVLMQTSRDGVGKKRFIMGFVRVVNIVFQWGTCGTPTFDSVGSLVLKHRFEEVGILSVLC